ncbi:MAG: hypothetical protein A2Y62_02300 [Candidatus Fischerbacteria bacterium RBG_13_37_8]|uniref:Beta-phosphoglucomutase n=1 Tax=Candidatus Fischerbacteria bacterium RBG_13_37_8 TaxID=1817863 RepID=A0A1F5VPI4_9BACT|nr:MAG: hypothetical protein A2Y62_02300 [Candidatus Fischerbacteria bacterium RBG_13_37_8]
MKAVLFDLDGVIIDSGDFHFQAWQIFCSKFNKNITYEKFKKGFGQTNRDILQDMLERSLTDEEIQCYSDEKEEIFRSIARGSITPIKGAVAFIISLKEQNVAIALVSSTPRINIDFILKEIGLEHSFHIIISSEDVSEGKPSPECYLKASQKLDREPEDCIVIEDAIPGVQAALNAGMPCIAITTTQPAEKLHHATYIIDDYTDIDPAWLE